MDIKDVIIEQTVGNVYWKDRDGIYLGCNKEFAEIIGLSSPQEIIGKTDHDLFLASLGEAQVLQTRANDQQILEEDQEKTIEEVGLDPQKRIAYYLTRKAPLKDTQGTLIGLIGTSINITKEKQASLAKQAFLENISHDIRTPVSGIVGLSAILHQHSDDGSLDQATIKEMLGDINNSATVLLELLDHVLYISSFGKDPIKEENLSVKALIDEVIGMLVPTIKAKQLSIEVNCPNIFVKTDKFRFSRILLNLMSNAIKFTDVGGVKINAYFDFEKQLTVEIVDSGIGISEDQLDQIFDQFYKVAPSNESPMFRGYGLGLYLVRSMADELGGKVTVQSQPGKGSTFSFMLS